MNIFWPLRHLWTNPKPLNNLFYFVEIFRLRVPSCSSEGSRLSTFDVLDLDDNDDQDEVQDQAENPVEVEQLSIIEEFACAMVHENLVQSCLNKTADDEMTEETQDVENDDTENKEDAEQPSSLKENPNDLESSCPPTLVESLPKEDEVFPDHSKSTPEFERIANVLEQRISEIDPASTDGDPENSIQNDSQTSCFNDGNLNKTVFQPNETQYANDEEDQV